MSRRYVEADLKGLTKGQLVSIIQSQPEHVPKPFNRSKIHKSALLDLLLSPATPFRTSDPPLSVEDNTSEHTSLADGHDNGAPMVEDRLEGPKSPVPQGDDLNQMMEVSESMGGNLEPTIGDRGNMAIRLYVEDGRHQGRILEKISKTINVEGVLVAPNAVQIRTHDVLYELQASSGAIGGTDCVRVGFVDPVSPEFTEFFTESNPSSLHLAPTDPATHVIDSQKPSLTLRVDYSNPEAQRPSGHRSSSPPRPESSVPLAPNNRSLLVEWLRMKASESDGYQVFTHSKHHVRPNSDISQSWKFAAAFSRRYFKQVHPFASLPGKVQKSDIYHALEVGETWLSQAEEAGRIIEIFGDGGTHPSPEVTSRLSQSHEPFEGSVSLLRFLREWNRTHHPDL